MPRGSAHTPLEQPNVDALQSQPDRAFRRNGRATLNLGKEVKNRGHSQEETCEETSQEEGQEVT